MMPAGSLRAADMAGLAGWLCAALAMCALPPLAQARPGEDAAAHAQRVSARAGPSLLEFFLTDVPMVWGTGERAVASWMNLK